MAEENSDQKTAKGITKKDLESLLRYVTAQQSDVSTAAGNIGDRIQNDAEKKNLHRGAFAVIRKLHKWAKDNPAKVAEWLFHFDLMREHLELDKAAGEDMLPDRKKGAKADKGKNGSADDKDGRPRHLRTVEGGAGQTT